MFRPEEIQVVEEFGNQVAPHQIRITHLASGVSVLGNTGSEEYKPRLREELIAKLAKCVPNAQENPQVQNDSLQAQLEALQAQIAALMAGAKPEKQAKPTQAAKKSKGRPKGSKMVDGKLVLPDGMKEGDPPTHPEGYSVLDPGAVAAPPMVAAPPRQHFKAPTVVTRGEIA